MAQVDRPVYMTHLDTLLGFLTAGLNDLNQRVESAANLDFTERAGLLCAVDHLRNTFDMVAEIVVAHESLLHEVAKSLDSLADADRMDPHGLQEVFNEYTCSLGTPAADRLFAKALTKA